MKGSHRIKKLYGVVGRGYGGGERICPKLEAKGTGFVWPDPTLVASVTDKFFLYPNILILHLIIHPKIQIYS